MHHWYEMLFHHEWYSEKYYFIVYTQLTIASEYYINVDIGSWMKNIFVQLRGPPEPEETGLQLSNGDQQEKKKHQLQSERQQEYNDMLAKVSSNIHALYIYQNIFVSLYIGVF